jgi:K(+)-stimulated pyrophosphate-energized sodium pump
MMLFRKTMGRNFLAAFLFSALLAVTLAALAPSAFAQDAAATSTPAATATSTAPAATAPGETTAAPTTEHHGGEANLKLPDLRTVNFAGGINGHALLLFGLVVCVLGLLFGAATYGQLKNLPVHKAMLEISELIYETCKTYLIQQGKFLIVLWAFISAIVLVYFGWLAVSGVDAAGNIVRGFPPFKVAVILFFSLVGMAGSYAVAWFGIRINTFANSRTAFASL